MLFSFLKVVVNTRAIGTNTKYYSVIIMQTL